jgi:hypothetical protein
LPRSRENRLTARHWRGTGKIMKQTQTGKLETTLGELIAAASEVAFEYSNNDMEAYQLARLALVEILRQTSHPFDLDKEFKNSGPSSQLIH